MIKNFFIWLHRLFSGACMGCGSYDLIEYGYYGNHRCNSCGKKQ